MHEMQVNWEFEEWYNNISFWCEMDVELNFQLEEASRGGCRIYRLQTSHSDGYTWDLMEMIQYHDFLGHNNNPKQTSRRIRRCCVLHAPWTGDPRKDYSRMVYNPRLFLWKPIWEFEEWHKGNQYWAEMDDEYVAQLNEAYDNCKDLVEYEMYDEDSWYEWHLDIMMQYRYFFKLEWYEDEQYWALKRSSRSIRKIIVQTLVV